MKGPNKMLLLLGGRRIFYYYEECFCVLVTWDIFLKEKLKQEEVNMDRVWDKAEPALPWRAGAWSAITCPRCSWDRPAHQFAHQFAKRVDRPA